LSRNADRLKVFDIGGLRGMFGFKLEKVKIWEKMKEMDSGKKRLDICCV
jgi:hypothetical protein